MSSIWVHTSTHSPEAKCKYVTCTADIFVDLFKQQSSVRVPVYFKYVGKYCAMFGVIHINIFLCSCYKLFTFCEN